MEYIERRLAAKTPVYDHADQLLYFADRDKARALMQRTDVDIFGTRKRITGLRFRGPDPALQIGGSQYRRPIGSPHQSENYYNLAGVWHIDRIPVAYRPHFEAVVLDCLKEAA